MKLTKHEKKLMNLFFKYSKEYFDGLKSPPDKKVQFKILMRVMAFSVNSFYERYKSIK